MSTSGISSIYIHIPKFDGTNWFSFKKDAEAYFQLESLWDVVSSTTASPSDPLEAASWERKDKRAYSLLYFLIDPNVREIIMESSSGNAAWKLLIAEYQKDNPAARLALRNQFYSIRHDPAKPVTVFLSSIQSVVRQLSEIKHKPGDDEVSDLILLRLHPSFAPVRSSIIARENAPSLVTIFSMVKEFEVNEKTVHTAEVEVKEEVKEEGEGEARNEAFYVGGRGRGRRGGDRERAEFDWGNSQAQDGVCFRCGRPNHQAARCVADMPKEVKEKILHAGAAFEDGPVSDDYQFALNASLFVDSSETATSSVALTSLDDMSDYPSGLTGYPASSGYMGFGNQGVQGLRGCEKEKVRTRRGKKKLKVSSSDGFTYF